MFIFSTYLPVFLLKFQWGELVGCRIKLRIQQVPTRHILMQPAIQKTRNTWKKRDDDVIITFSGISFFLVSGVRQKYVEWVLVGCRILFRIQWAVPIEIWVKKRDICWKYGQKNYFFMIPIPKFILKNCLRPIRYFKFKAISLANTWWHGIWIKVKRHILSWNFL